MSHTSGRQFNPGEPRTNKDYAKNVKDEGNWSGRNRGPGKCYSETGDPKDRCYVTTNGGPGGQKKPDTGTASDKTEYNKRYVKQRWPNGVDRTQYQKRSHMGPHPAGQNWKMKENPTRWVWVGPDTGNSIASFTVWEKEAPFGLYYKMTLMLENGDTYVTFGQNLSKEHWFKRASILYREGASALLDLMHQPEKWQPFRGGKVASSMGPHPAGQNWKMKENPTRWIWVGPDTGNSIASFTVWEKEAPFGLYYKMTLMLENGDTYVTFGQNLSKEHWFKRASILYREGASALLDLMHQPEKWQPFRGGKVASSRKFRIVIPKSVDRVQYHIYDPEEGRSRSLTYSEMLKLVVSKHFSFADNRFDGAYAYFVALPGNGIFSVTPSVYAKLQVPDSTKSNVLDRYRSDLAGYLVSEMPQMRDKVDFNVWRQQSKPSPAEQIEWLSRRTGIPVEINPVNVHKV